MKALWTLDGDETSWSSWAEEMRLAPATPFMQDLVASIQPNSHGWALDVGCGTGRAFLPLIAAGYQVIGIDPTWAAIHFCQERVNQAGIKAYPILASASQIPLPSQSISFAFALSCLFHLSQDELTSALSEIRRLLVPSGKAILHFLDLGDWRHTLAKEIRPQQAPIPSYKCVITCFCGQQMVREWINRSGLLLTRLELRKSSSQAGEQRNWIAYCEG
jgi:SAM-dependent methyltransferase